MNSTSAPEKRETRVGTRLLFSRWPSRPILAVLTVPPDYPSGRSLEPGGVYVLQRLAEERVA